MNKIKVIAFSKQGARVANKLVQKLKFDYNCTGYFREEYLSLNENKLSLSVFSKEAFDDSMLIIYVGAIGIAVRAIAPYLKSKNIDPAIICIDDQARYVIPILSGHLGRANEYSHLVSQILEATPIITTSTDINNVFAVDIFAQNNDLFIKDISKIKYISSRLLNNEKIGWISEYPLSLLPDFVDDNQEVGIYLGEDDKQPFKITLQLIPKKYVVGMGMRKDKNFEEVEKFFLETLENMNVDYQLVNTIVSIDLKKEEVALLKLCSKYKYKFITFSKDELQEVEGEFTQSDFVKKITGVDNVCERSIAKIVGYENLVMKKETRNGISIAIGQQPFKCKF